MRSFMLLFALLLVAVLPAACSEMNPDTRTGIWHPTGINARNLAAMMADPADAVRGRGVAGADSPLAIAAATRLMEGKPKGLIETPSQTISTGGSGPSGQQGGS